LLNLISILPQPIDSEKYGCKIGTGMMQAVAIRIRAPSLI